MNGMCAIVEFHKSMSYFKKRERLNYREIE